MMISILVTILVLWSIIGMIMFMCMLDSVDLDNISILRMNYVALLCGPVSCVLILLIDIVSSCFYLADKMKSFVSKDDIF
jgi:hypothetical protein